MIAHPESLERFVRSLRAAWGDGTDPRLPETARNLVERLIADCREQPWIDELFRARQLRRELHRDPECGFILMAHVETPAHRTTPHDHGPCWVVYAVVRGATEITTYRRTDDRSVPGKAALEQDRRLELTPGAATAYLPGDIHATRAVAPTLLFRFLSADLTRFERFRYDVQAGTVSRRPPGA